MPSPSNAPVLEVLMEGALVRQVWQRAGRCCEYCLIPQHLDILAFEIDHIIARKHGGITASNNLALSCFHDNSHKGSNIAGIDPKGGGLTPLFNPRRHKWSRHFHFEGARLFGLTAIGRVTIAVLNINDLFRVELREELIEEGLFPLH